MDESEVDICQDANNTNALREENEEFTDDLESGNGTDVRQKKDGANDFESLTRPISAVSNALKDRFLKSNSGEEKTDDDTYNQNNVEASGNEIHATVPNDSLEHETSIENASEVDPCAEVPAGPRSSSPAFGNDPSDITEEIRKLYISKNDSEVDVDCVDQLNVSFPEVPTDDPEDLVDQSSIDGGSESIASSHSLSKSYIYSCVSVGEDIPNPLRDDGDYLIPKYKPDGKGFCWPNNKLPLSGDHKFEEDAQWKISKKIGQGAVGQCFLGYPVGKENNLFCVKKTCQYNEEELKALCLAAKDIYAKTISEGAKNIVLLYGATYCKPNVCIFMEYMEGGTVHRAIIEANRHYKDGLDKIDCVHYFKDVFLALKFIHSKGIRHNDVKADNVLLTKSKVQAKLCDFGKAVAISQHNPASTDVWSGGCFLLEMLGKKYSKALMSGFLKKGNVLDGDRLPEDVEQDTYEVLSKCFCAERNKYTASDVLKSAFFNDKVN